MSENNNDHDIFNKSNKLINSNMLNIGSGIEKFQDSKFCFKQILDKSLHQETYKKSFFILSEELNEEDEEMSNKLKRDFILKRIISDRKIISNKLIPEKFLKDVKPKEKTDIELFNENMISEIYNGMSAESREFHIENNNIDDNTINFFQTLVNFNYENYLKHHEINNDLILNLCGNLVRIEDLFMSPQENITGEMNDDDDQIRQNKIVQDMQELQNNIKDKKSKKFTIIDIPLNYVAEEKYSEPGINKLLDYLKNSKDQPVTEKMEKLLQVFAKNKLNDNNIRIDSHLKEMLLKNLKEEFIKEKEILNKKKDSNKNVINNKHSTPTKELNLKTNSQDILKKGSPIFIDKNKSNEELQTKIINKVSSNNFNRDNSNILSSESEYEVKNPFIDALHNNKKTNPISGKKNNFEKIKDNLGNKVSYTNSGWGVNNDKSNKFELKKSHKIANNSTNKLKNNIKKNKGVDDSDDWIKFK